jgi:hypothetical protein
MRLDGPQSQSGNGSKEKNSFRLLEIEKSLQQVTTLVVNCAVACMSERDACKIYV